MILGVRLETLISEREILKPNLSRSAQLFKTQKLPETLVVSSTHPTTYLNFLPSGSLIAMPLPDYFSPFHRDVSGSQTASLAVE
jgi:hypothetical protein